MEHQLDTRGLRCPLPLRLADQRVRELHPGDVLELVGDDPVLGLDCAAWCFDQGHRLLERRGEPPAPGPIVCRIEIGTGGTSAPAGGSR